jgi:hypothetical protein
LPAWLCVQPTATEKAHDFLWRSHAGLPEHGSIGVFNRRYYEDVLVTRVHPSRMDKSTIAHGHRDVLSQDPLSPHPLWEERLQSIRDHELHLARNGTIVRKFMLNVSNEMQARRLFGRLNRPEKQHKFSASDLPERSHWDAYQQAYTEAIAATSKPWAPWYVVPADNKLYMQERVAVCPSTCPCLCIRVDSPPVYFPSAVRNDACSRVYCWLPSCFCLLVAAVCTVRLYAGYCLSDLGGLARPFGGDRQAAGVAVVLVIAVKEAGTRRHQGEAARRWAAAASGRA